MTDEIEPTQSDPGLPRPDCRSALRQLQGIRSIPERAKLRKNVMIRAYRLWRARLVGAFLLAWETDL